MVDHFWPGNRIVVHHRRRKSGQNKLIQRAHHKSFLLLKCTLCLRSNSSIVIDFPISLTACPVNRIRHYQTGLRLQVCMISAIVTISPGRQFAPLALDCDSMAPTVFCLFRGPKRLPIHQTTTPTSKQPTFTRDTEQRTLLMRSQGNRVTPRICRDARIPWQVNGHRIKR